MFIARRPRETEPRRRLLRQLIGCAQATVDPVLPRQGPGGSKASSDLRGPDFRLRHMAGADLACSQLRGANLSGAYLVGANLAWSDLHSADLTDASAANIMLVGARLESASMCGARSWMRRENSHPVR